MLCVSINEHIIQKILCLVQTYTSILWVDKHIVKLLELKNFKAIENCKSKFKHKEIRRSLKSLKLQQLLIIDQYKLMHDTLIDNFSGRRELGASIYVFYACKVVCKIKNC